MAEIIAFANRKGGSGKSTSVANIAALLADRKKRVLVVDMDSQSHATLSLGVNPYEIENSIYELLIGEELNFSDILVSQPKWKIDILPASRRLASAEIDLPNLPGNQFRLRGKLIDYQDQYDFILIDCPPALGPLSINALVASHHVIIPMTVHFLAMEGLVQMIDVVNQVAENLNSGLRILGILPTFADTRTNLTGQVISELKSHFPENMILPMVRRNVKLAEAPSFGIPIHRYAPRSNGAYDYKKVANRLVRLIKNQKESRDKGK